MSNRAFDVAAAGPRESVLDPYFVLAKRTNFADYRSAGSQPLGTYAVSVELDPNQMPLPSVTGLTVRAAHETSAYFTGTATPEAYESLMSQESVRRVQFAQPLVPPREAASRRTSHPKLQLREALADTATTKDTLLGIVDSGCPFAHQTLRRGSGTRVLSLWNQDQETCPAGLGATPVGFGYGHEFSRAQLNQLLSTATDVAGSVDEDLCYRLAGYEQVFHRRTHAAHSLGLLAGSGELSFGSNRLSPKARLPEMAASPSSDVVFVQLPQVLMDCISVAALEHHAIDGFRHILSVAKKHEHKKVVISFGYESWVGPHDGSSWFEKALASLVADAEASGTHLNFFLAAGNSRNRRSHATLQAQRGTASLRWRVPPGNEVPTFLEIWAPTTEEALTVKVTPPGQRALPKLQWGQSLVFPTAEKPGVGIVMHRSIVLGTGGYIILIRVSPTHCWDSERGTAPHGIWTVTLEGVRTQAPEIHAHIGRVEGDVNSLRRAFQPTFVGRSVKQDTLDKARTLNGHACGEESKVCGVFYSDDFPYRTIPDERGGVTPARKQPADYSGSGPTRHRTRPDVSMPMEDGLYHEGTLSIGTRSACVWRMKGTSTAAPAAARMFAEGMLIFPAEKGNGGQPPTGNLALGSVVWDPSASYSHKAEGAK